MPHNCLLSNAFVCNPCLPTYPPLLSTHASSLIKSNVGLIRQRSTTTTSSSSPAVSTSILHTLLIHAHPPYKLPLTNTVPVAPLSSRWLIFSHYLAHCFKPHKLFSSHFLLLCGDMQSNPGTLSASYFKICKLNIRSLLNKKH